MKRVTLEILFASLVLIISLGCANNISLSKTVKTDEEMLRERVLQYWQHKINLDLDKAYEFEDPAYRAVENKVRYIRHHNIDMVRWKSVEIQGIEIADDRAEVKLKLMVILLLPGMKDEHAMPTFVNDRWVKVDGVWYHRFVHGGMAGSS